MPNLAEAVGLRLDHALTAFATATATQSQQHIRPLHRYLAARLVIEGGFLPEEVIPRPPFRSERRRGVWNLHLDLEASGPADGTVLGGIKTKQVDVVVTKPRLGPVLVVSVKGTVGAFRNLTNRMEEAVGDSANIHLHYPGLVFGFVHVLRGNRPGPGVRANDLALNASGEVVPSIRRFHEIMRGMVGRRFLRNDVARYEAGCLIVVDMQTPGEGQVFAGFPAANSPLGISQFFPTLYRTYDLRYPYVAENMPESRRVVWDPSSPAFESLSEQAMQELLGYPCRLSAEEPELRDLESEA